MILEVSWTGSTSHDIARTNGASDEARFVTDQTHKGWRRLQTSDALGLGRKVFEELEDVAEACSTENWDGYGATPVSRLTEAFARHFLETLPLGTPAPAIGAEPDGCLTLEWHRSPHQTVSVSVSQEGYLHYAALLGPNKVNGTEAFFGEAPAAILNLIFQVGAR